MPIKCLFITQTFGLHQCMNTELYIIKCILVTNSSHLANVVYILETMSTANANTNTSSNVDQIAGHSFLVKDIPCSVLHNP